MATARSLTLALFTQGLGNECGFGKAAYCPTSAACMLLLQQDSGSQLDLYQRRIGDAALQ